MPARRPRPEPEPRWFLRDGDHIDGPHAQSRILAWHEEGRLRDGVLISRDGQTWHGVRWPGERRRTPNQGRS